MALRIKGLVGFASRILDRLSGGVPPREVASLRLAVEGTLREVEAICERHETSPEDLPAPSRNAYRRLKQIDLTNLGTSPSTETRESSRGVVIRISNVVKNAERLSARLARLGPADDLSRARGDAEQTVRLVDEICADQGASPASLPDPSARAYAWLRFLTDEPRLRAHVAALARAQAALRALATSDPTRVPGSSTRVELANQAAIWRWRGGRDERVLVVNEGFLEADDGIWRALVSAATGRRQARLRDQVRRWTEGDAYRAIVRELSAITRDDDAAARGAVHDLGESFRRVNAAYFEGRVERPELRWGRQETVRRFGSYEAARDRITLSRSLDADEVPAFVMDYVVYHELLHKLHGVEDRGLRRAAHTAAFRGDEARFAQRGEAERLLSKIARRRRK